MKLIKITGALLSMALTIATASAQGDGKEQLVVPLSQPGKPIKLNVGLTNGSIKVITYEGKDVIIDADTDGDLRRKEKEHDRETNRNRNSKEGETNGMRRITPVGGLDISAEERNNAIVVHSDSWKRPVNLIIKVPQNITATMKLSTSNQGDITVNNIEGDMEINNLNGAIYMNNVSGSVVATSLNGKILVNFKSIDPKAAMAFSTLNGNVDVSFPATLKADVKLQSDHGEMYTDFDVEADKSQPKVNKTSQGGLYRINIESWVYGKIGGGGPQLMMKTMNGNIYVRKGK